jgi:hypothetical protein
MSHYVYEGEVNSKCEVCLVCIVCCRMRGVPLYL